MWFKVKPAKILVKSVVSDEAPCTCTVYANTPTDPFTCIINCA